MAPGKHSPYSPSKAEIYFNCPGAIASQAEVGPRKSSRAAKNGQRAHFLGETSLRENKAPNDYLFETLRNDEGNDSFHVTEELATAVTMYYDFVQDIIRRAKSPDLMIEIRLEAVFAGQPVFGTCDCLIIDGSTLHVIDYKHGSGHAVEAIGNKQMMIYALMAAETLGEFTDIHLAIVQPNSGGEKEWWITAAELTQFKTELEEAITASLENPDEVRPGDHCLWCDAQANCRAYTASATQHLGTRQSVVIIPTADKMDDASLADYIHKMSQTMAKLRNSLRTAEQLATARIQEGKILPGLEIKTGKTRRMWVDTKKVLDLFGDKAISKDIKSPSQLEKSLKLAKGSLESQGLITQTQGAETLHKTWQSDFEDLDETGE